jgi:hypothetical protein
VPCASVPRASECVWCAVVVFGTTPQGGLTSVGGTVQLLLVPPGLVPWKRNLCVCVECLLGMEGLDHMSTENRPCEEYSHTHSRGFYGSSIREDSK